MTLRRTLPKHLHPPGRRGARCTGRTGPRLETPTLPASALARSFHLWSYFIEPLRDIGMRDDVPGIAGGKDVRGTRGRGGMRKGCVHSKPRESRNSSRRTHRYCRLGGRHVTRRKSSRTAEAITRSETRRASLLLNQSFVHSIHLDGRSFLSHLSPFHHHTHSHAPFPTLFTRHTDE